MNRSPIHALATALGLSAAALLAAPAAAQQAQPGSLAAGDAQLEAGEYYDLTELNLQAGQTVTIEMRSNEIDTYLVVILPNGEALQNDDIEGEPGVSRLTVQADAAGAYQVLATSYAPEETGNYTLAITQGAGGAANIDGGGGGIGGGGQPLIPAQQGQLAAGDNQLESGEYYDLTELNLRAGQTITVEMRSNEIDTYLGVIQPDGSAVENDDVEGEPGVSRVVLEAPADGVYQVLATSYAPEETGNYTLTVTEGAQGGGGAIAGSEIGAVLMQQQGQLAQGDGQLDSGEFADPIEFQVQAGQHVIIDLTSQEFDTYLVVRPAGAEQLDNDDYNQSRNQSRIEFVAPVAGAVQVIVTSYEPGETGNYNLIIAAPADAGSSDGPIEGPGNGPRTTPGGVVLPPADGPDTPRTTPGRVVLPPADSGGDAEDSVDSADNAGNDRLPGGFTPSK